MKVACRLDRCPLDLFTQPHLSGNKDWPYSTVYRHLDGIIMNRNKAVVVVVVVVVVVEAGHAVLGVSIIHRP